MEAADRVDVGLLGSDRAFSPRAGRVLHHPSAPVRSACGRHGWCHGRGDSHAVALVFHGLGTVIKYGMTEDQRDGNLPT